MFAGPLAAGCTVLTENVGDFTRIAAEHSTAGQRHPGALIALSSRLSRRRSGIPTLVAAITGLGDQALQDRIIHLRRASA